MFDIHAQEFWIVLEWVGRNKELDFYFQVDAIGMEVAQPSKQKMEELSRLESALLLGLWNEMKQQFLLCCW